MLDTDNLKSPFTKYTELVKSIVYINTSNKTVRRRSLLYFIPKKPDSKTKTLTATIQKLLIINQKKPLSSMCGGG